MPAALPSARPKPDNPATPRGGTMVGSIALWNTAENSNATLANATSAPTMNNCMAVAFGGENHISTIAVIMMAV